MRILIFLLKFIVALILLLTIVSFFLPANSHVERSIVINANAKSVFEQLNNLHNWEKWSPWHRKDTAMVITYEGNESGEGAMYTWKSNHSQVGNGKMEISASIPYDSIQTTMNMEGMGKSHAAFKLVPDGSSTKVTWSMDSKNEDMPLLWRIPSKYFGLLMDKMIGPDFEAGLSELKKLAEANPAFEYSIAEVEVPSMLIVTYKTTTNLNNISKDIGASYGKIGQFMMKNKLQQAGPVMAYYHSFNPEKIEMECAIQVDKEAKSANDINVYKTQSCQAAKVMYYGAYEKTEAAHDAIHNWVAANNKTISGSPWEVYVTDPMSEKDTAKWLTEIYYPIK
jgi:effector-binding domain-containing protein